ncbi:MULTISPECIES: hypothetical protein [Pseudomonas]|uniref:hypothetical protein n=1 Tax=Pseudomonas TaxID=286 RepID=UPI000C298C28|nr:MULTISPECIES: hypothetical protein [Pseudomonas]PJY96148.1 hypothetical protein COO64_11105 [Pseudomonas donghuensis]UVM66147.1 hypothetical protein LOY34_23015 [Pseudomonas sp. B21-009]WKY27613.1 hypothetical protein QYF67_22515 [Pseudomonas donghuensis]
MSVRRHHFVGPFHDPYGAAFCLYKPGDINWRHRIIAGVSWNGQTQQAFFFNPDGLTIPLRANPWEMPAFMRKHGLRREFSAIYGSGPFSMDEQRRADLNARQLAEWVTYWFTDETYLYSNDPEVWGDWVERDLEQERVTSEQSHAFGREQIDLETFAAECVAKREEWLMEEHRRRCLEDARIFAWLKGEAHPPASSN